MLAIHDQFTHEMRSRLKTNCMGLGLVRLLQDAMRFEEARATLYSLEFGFPDAAEKSKTPGQIRGKTNRSKGVRATASCSLELASTRIERVEALTQPLSIA